MGLRLAGAGNQVGMTEAQIFIFFRCSSSVGCAAEAGGSAFSKVMLNMNNEVLSGGENLKLYAQIAGMRADEFATAWKDNAAMALVAFIEGLGRMQEQGQNVVPVLDELGFSELRVRDALMRAAGAGDLFRESLELGTQAWEENTALNKEAEERFKTTASQLTLLRNNVAPLADSFGQLLLPIVNGVIERFIPLIQALTEMDDGTKRVIIVIGGLGCCNRSLAVRAWLIYENAPGYKKRIKFAQSCSIRIGIGVILAGCPSCSGGGRGISSPCYMGDQNCWRMGKCKRNYYKRMERNGSRS